MGKFVVKTRSNGDYQFNLVADNGQVILSSQGYAGKDGCMNGIQSVRANGQVLAMFEKLSSENGKFYFNLKAGNGQVIGTSQMYESEAGRDNGIESVMGNAANSEITEA